MQSLFCSHILYLKCRHDYNTYIQGTLIYRTLKLIKILYQNIYIPGSASFASELVNIAY